MRIELSTDRIIKPLVVVPRIESENSLASGLPGGEEITKAQIDHFSLFYGKFQALKDISLGIWANKITAIIGPSGCGKSTLLRSLNRMNDLVPNVRVEGKIYSG